MKWIKGFCIVCIGLVETSVVVLVSSIFALAYGNIVLGGRIGDIAAGAFLLMDFHLTCLGDYGRYHWFVS